MKIIRAYVIQIHGQPQIHFLDCCWGCDFYSSERSGNYSCDKTGEIIQAKDFSSKVGSQCPHQEIELSMCWVNEDFQCPNCYPNHQNGGHICRQEQKGTWRKHIKPIDRQITTTSFPSWCWLPDRGEE